MRFDTFLFLTCLLLSMSYLNFLSAQDQNAEEEEWVWYDAEGNERTRAELDTILAMHDRGLKELRQNCLRIKKEYGFTETYEDELMLSLILSGMTFTKVGDPTQRVTFEPFEGDSLQADLTYCRLSGGEFLNVRLTGARLMSSVFTSSLFFRTDLRKAAFWFSDLSESYFAEVNLCEAGLGMTNLKGTSFYDCNLRNASISSANLTGASFIRTNLSNADLSSTILKGVVFEPDSLPQIYSIAHSYYIDKMTYDTDPGPLYHLKNAFINAGFKTQAKQVNAALQRKDQTVFEYIFYDLTCEWGSNHMRPLLILLIFIILMGALYRLLGIYYIEQSVYLIASQKGLAKEQELKAGKWKKLKNGLLAFGIAFLFSLQRSLRIGFREISPSHWLLMLLPPEFKLQSRGWPRFVSGVQSLISVGLIVLSLLSYFGRPFEF